MCDAQQRSSGERGASGLAVWLGFVGALASCGETDGLSSSGVEISYFAPTTSWPAMNAQESVTGSRGVVVSSAFCAYGTGRSTAPNSSV